MYALKSKGTSKVPDSVQIRDDNFAIIDNIKLNSLSKKLSEYFPNNYKNIIQIINNADFNKIIEINKKL
ncbi:MAG: hypothetical protein JXR68_00700 [Bacteroidales bacterium]|nr:hypothetical protein [Bacteroidales bacterium]